MTIIRHIPGRKIRTCLGIYKYEFLEVVKANKISCKYNKYSEDDILDMVKKIIGENDEDDSFDEYHDIPGMIEDGKLTIYI